MSRTEPAAPLRTGRHDSWTQALSRWIEGLVPKGQWLPDRQPAYVASWIYVFGVASLASLVVVIGSGLVLTFGGITWWHTNSFGHFVNSMHLWSVELFFATMVIHLWGKFFMAAWRGHRGLTWATGALAFFGSLGTAFTGYLIQTNFDAQWISTQAKDGLNAAGVGAYFNVMNVGQMVLWHVSFLPLVVGVIVGLHLLLVRRRGVVPPIGAESPTGATAPAAAPQPGVTERPLADRPPTRAEPPVGAVHRASGASAQKARS
jgi:ubiquinol-cytochrome c reductase cytochrome b subunit